MFLHVICRDWIALISLYLMMVECRAFTFPEEVKMVQFRNFKFLLFLPFLFCWVHTGFFPHFIHPILSGCIIIDDVSAPSSGYNAFNGRSMSQFRIFKFQFTCKLFCLFVRFRWHVCLFASTASSTTFFLFRLRPCSSSIFVIIFTKNNHKKTHTQPSSRNRTHSEKYGALHVCMFSLSFLQTNTKITCSSPFPGFSFSCVCFDNWNYLLAFI